MTKQFLDSLRVKGGHSLHAADLLTKVAFQFGFRAVSSKELNKETPSPVTGRSDLSTIAGWNKHYEYLCTRLKRLTAKTNPSKKVLIGFLDLREEKIDLFYECTLKEDGKTTWIECIPNEIIC